MTDWDPATGPALFAGIVPEGIDTAYGTLLDAGRVPVPDAARVLGGDSIVQALADLGMTHIEQEAPEAVRYLVPNSPALALQGVMAVHGARLVHDIELLHTATQRSADAHGQLCAGHDNPTHLARIYTDADEITSASASFINSARREWMTLYSAPRDTWLGDDTIVDPPPEARPGIRRRSIYDQATADNPDGMRIIRQCIARGEEVRILPKVRAKMMLADTTAVFLALSSTAMRGAIMIHSSPFAEAMREYFEFLWERAIPLDHKAHRRKNELNPEQQLVLDYLAHGHNDGWIAEKIGKDVSAVRRRVREIRVMLRAISREQAFAIAGSRGMVNWIADDRGGGPATTTSS